MKLIVGLIDLARLPFLLAVVWWMPRKETRVWLNFLEGTWADWRKRQLAYRTIFWLLKK